MAQQFQLPVHHHGKSKVRVGRTWRSSTGDVAYFVEWNVNTMLEASDAQGTTWFKEVGTRQ
jgi:hypothetical protein